MFKGTSDGIILLVAKMIGYGKCLVEMAIFLLNVVQIILRNAHCWVICFVNRNPQSGGMTYDIAMYMAQLGQVAYPDSEVERIQAMSTFKNGIDQTVLANIMYTNKNAFDSSYDETGTKGMLQFYVTGAANTEERVTVQGTLGRIVLDPPAHVPEKVRLFIDAGRGKSIEEVFDFSLPDDSWTSWNYPGSIGFTHEIRAVNDALRNGQKECHQFTWNNSIQLATIIDEIILQTRGQRQKYKNQEIDKSEKNLDKVFIESYN